MFGGRGNGGFEQSLAKDQVEKTIIVEDCTLACGDPDDASMFLQICGCHRSVVSAGWQEQTQE